MEETDSGIPPTELLNGAGFINDTVKATEKTKGGSNGEHLQLEDVELELDELSMQSPPERLKSTEELVAKDLPTDDELSDDLRKPYYFGIRSFHPKALQILANKKVFTIMMCIYIILQGSVVAGINSVNVSSLETRYALSSTLAALIFSIFDAFVIIFVIFISYFGGRTHRPRFLGITLIILGVGNIVTASPQFFFGSYKQDFGSPNSTYEECFLGFREEPAETCTRTNIGAYIIILIGQGFLAAGSASVYTVAVAYIDEIVYPKFVSLHIGVVLMFGVIGPAIGYLLGSALLSIYVDPWVTTDLTPNDPAWVGAWWIGPLLMGVLSFFAAVPFFMFPKWLPDSHLVRIERAKEMAKTYTSDLVHENNLTLIVKQFPLQIKDLLTNVSYMSTTLALAMIFVVKDGVVTFGPKYIESMFSVTATQAGLMTGAIGVTGAAIGVITGAIIVYLWKPVGRQTAIIQVVVVALAIPFVMVFLLKCPTVQVAGITTPYSDGSSGGRDSSSCANNCSCHSSVYEPVCGDDRITYFSPCRAGCRVDQLDDDSYTFRNCSCISSYQGMSNSTATEGACDNGCSKLPFFLILLFILVFMMLTIEIPYYHYTLRVVADDQRPLALGLQSAIYRTVGSIPGPLLFGAMVDLSCVDWDYNCDVRGNCWIYDNDKLSFNAIMLCLPFVILSAILMFVGLLTYPKKKKTKLEQVTVTVGDETATTD